MCKCGIPSEANWYLTVTFAYPTELGASETTYTDGYLCDEHFPGYSDGSMSDTDIRSLAWFAPGAPIDILEYEATHLRDDHADYPHEPGRLYDCPACESKCHCTPGTTECVFDGEHNEV